MSYKILWLLIALCGLLLVAGLVLLGIDLRRAAKTGPKWKRQLLGAALVLLGAAGLLHFVTKEREDAAGAPPQGTEALSSGGAPPSQGATPGDWRAVVGAWVYAKPLATRGQSTTAERKAADEKLTAAKAAIGRLEKAGELSSAEAGLLKVEAADIREDIYRESPTDGMETCYNMIYLPPARKSLTRLSKRLPLLEKLAGGGKLNATACEKIIAAAEADLKVLASEQNLTRAQLSAGERAKVVKTREAVRSALRRLRWKLNPPRLRRPGCYKPMHIRPRPPQSMRELDERLARLDTLDREGRLAPEVAARVREEIALAGRRGAKG